jgi:hypothetical protein
MDPVTPTPEEPQGKVLASYLVRVTLRAQTSYPGLPAPTADEIPTNARLAEIVSHALFADCAFIESESDEIRVSSERTDR